MPHYKYNELLDKIEIWAHDEKPSTHPGDKTIFSPGPYPDVSHQDFTPTPILSLVCLNWYKNELI